MKALLYLMVCLVAALPAGARAEPGALQVALFEADVTPPLGAPLCDGFVEPAAEIVDPLLARGIVLLGAGEPIVLCAVDWVGAANQGHDTFRELLAQAAGTSPQRVALHCLHQHDAPGCDIGADALLAAEGLGDRLFDTAFARIAMKRTAEALKAGLEQARPMTHVGSGRGRVEQVASNRRVMGPDGKVRVIRWSSNPDPAVRAEPEGLIDPFVHALSFWNNDTPIVSITCYATHPQSYYGKGGVSCDFPGLARAARDKEQPEVFHVHFNGAGGNVTAGKYNDGSRETRPILARRLALGMRAALESTRRYPASANDVSWLVVPVLLPAAAHLDAVTLKATVANGDASLRTRLEAARRLAWLSRIEAGTTIDLTRLRIGPVDFVGMPGELFVEYQLAAQEMRKGSHVLMAAYGNYGPGYIGLEKSYSEGGYETGPVSLVAPKVEHVLTSALRDLLK